jgi:hypothetical protein
MQATSTPETVAAIRQANDTLRRTFLTGNVMLTQGIRALPEPTVAKILDAVQSFDSFDQGNDPHGEHDYGRLQVNGETVCWKIDYFDADLRYGSENPADPSITRRVMTIMLVSEY